MRRLLPAITFTVLVCLVTAPSSLFGTAEEEAQCHNLIEEVFCGWYHNPLNCVTIGGQEYCETIGAWRPSPGGD